MAGWLERWDRHNQELMEELNRRYRDDPVGDANVPGPAWAWAIGGLPLLHWIGDAAIAVDAWRRHRRRTKNST
jgi:hypothetical protein